MTRTHDDLVDALNGQIVKKLLSEEVLREVLVGTKDIAPTLLSYAGLPVPERMQGRNLIPELQGEPVEPRTELTVSGRLSFVMLSQSLQFEQFALGLD